MDADSEGGTVTLFDVIGNTDDGFEKTDQRMLVANALNVLSEREKQIIQLHILSNLAKKKLENDLVFLKCMFQDYNEKRLKNYKKLYWRSRWCSHSEEYYQ